jgi:hypothetical protein
MGVGGEPPTQKKNPHPGDAFVLCGGGGPPPHPHIYPSLLLKGSFFSALHQEFLMNHFRCLLVY